MCVCVCVCVLGGGEYAVFTSCVKILAPPKH